MSTAVDLDWDGWRAGYDEMTFGEMRDFYREVAALYPLQESANVCMAQEAFNLIDFPYKHVVELGGWNGRLAATMLQRNDVMFWENYDIVKVPQACANVSYRLRVLDDYLWNKPPVHADVFVACHTIEHIKARELNALIGNLRTRWVYLEAPLEYGPRDWTGYAGSHILEVGWEGVSAIMLYHGYRPIAENLWERQERRVT